MKAVTRHCGITVTAMVPIQPTMDNTSPATCSAVLTLSLLLCLCLSLSLSLSLPPALLSYIALVGRSRDGEKNTLSFPMTESHL